MADLLIPPTGNSYCFAASRTLYGMACDKQAPKLFAYTTKAGLPLPAVLLILGFGALAYMTVSTSGETVFNCE